MKKGLRKYLDSLVDKYNVVEFAENDPVKFPRRYSTKEDIEISALLTSTIAWGLRTSIMTNAEKLHAILDNQPYKFVLEGDIEAIGEGNIHRTLFGRHLKYYLRGLRQIYSQYASLEDFAAAKGIASHETPAWALAREIQAVLEQANEAHPLINEPNNCLPIDLQNSALKRFNMALRWLVRRDGIVDLGVWDVISPAQLYMPLDVHVANTSRALELLCRKSNDRKAVIELTKVLRTIRPDDPTIYDFALFSIDLNNDDLKLML